MRILNLIIIIFSLFSSSYLFSKDIVIDFKDVTEIKKVEGNYFILEDQTKKKCFSEIINSPNFKPWKKKMLNLGITSSTYWLLTHSVFLGYGFKFLWPENSWLAQRSIYIICSLCGIATVLFVMEFIKTKIFTPIIHKILFVIIFLEAISFILAINGNYILSYNFNNV